jgi:Lrp/AsnC family transcriptional regulator for asnA, asnC and gidA
MAFKIDELDRLLIDLLKDNAQQTSEKLAKKLKVSSATIRRRTRKLVQSGVVKIVAVADPRKLGYPLRAIVAFDVDHEQLDVVIDVLRRDKEIDWACVTAGRFDIVAGGQFASTDQLSEFLQKTIANTPGIRNSETLICLQVHKDRYL